MKNIATWVKVLLVFNALVVLTAGAAADVGTAFGVAIASAWCWFVGWGIRAGLRVYRARRAPPMPASPRIPKLTEDAARAACRKAFYAALFVSGVFAAVSLFALTTPVEVAAVLGFSAWGLVDAVLWLLVAVGLHRQSRVAAVIAPPFYVVEQVYGIAEATNASARIVPALVWSFFFLRWFIRGARGAFALAQWKKLPAAPAEAPPVPATVSPVVR